MWTRILVCSLAIVPLALAGPGFSTIGRKHLSLEIRKPGQMRLSNTSLAFTGNVTNPQYQPVLASLLTTLATEIVKEAASSNRTVREVATEQGVDDAVLAEALDFVTMARPHG